MPARKQKLLLENVGTREGQVAYLTSELKQAKRTADKIRIMDKIADLRGLKIESSIGDIKKLPTDELEDLLMNVCVPALIPYWEPLSEFVAERLSAGPGDAVLTGKRLSGDMQTESPSGRSVRSGQRSKSSPRRLSPKQGKNAIAVRWKSEWEVESSCPGD